MRCAQIKRIWTEWVLAVAPRPTFIFCRPNKGNIAVQQGLYESTLHSLPLLHRGKVRDMYAVDEHTLLIVTTDRISAFDVILCGPFPGEGQVISQLNYVWL